MRDDIVYHWATNVYGLNWNALTSTAAAAAAAVHNAAADSVAIQPYWLISGYRPTVGGLMADQGNRLAPHQVSSRPKPLWQPWSESDEESNSIRSGRERSGESADGKRIVASKDLPSRSKKERRRNDRHNEIISTAGRNKHGSRRDGEFCTEDEIIPKRMTGNHCTRENTDGPLDMSTGRRPSCSTSPPAYLRSKSHDSIGVPYNTSTVVGYPIYSSNPPEYGRPSVITCASSLRSSPAPSCPSPCSSTGSVSSSSNAAQPISHLITTLNRNRTDDSKPLQRREVISSGMCDPVIDEHFRRSLGERYSHLFSSSSTTSVAVDSSSIAPSGEAKLSSTVNVTGLSVDDHFAKALGDTWLKLQNDSNKEKENGQISSSQPDSPLTSQRHGLILT